LPAIKIRLFIRPVQVAIINYPNLYLILQYAVCVHPSWQTSIFENFCYCLETT